MKILVLGYFGYKSSKLDGQTVKTRSIYQLLQKKTVHNVTFFDTESLKCNKLRLFNLICNVCSCDRLVYLPAHGNLKYLFPCLYLLSIFCRYQIVYVVIGGWLSEFLKDKPLHRIMLRKIRVICVETKQMRCDLENKFSFSNVVILPNFREDISIRQSVIQNEGPDNKLRLVFMARIQMLKGLDYIRDLAEYIRCKKKSDMLILDFYGQIDENDKQYFDTLITTYSFLQYKGVLSPPDIPQTLCGYDLLILPTHYFTEGFPGSILEAYMAGIPVLVTNWKHATEFVDDRVTGFIIPFNNGVGELITIIDSLLLNKKRLELMKPAILEKVHSFSESTVWNTISIFFQE